jgi:threonine/homoserine/homoserine lactone efflux protein
MPTTETFLTFLVALALLEISPGPDMMLTIARGIGRGRRIALLTVLGNVFIAGTIQVFVLVFRPGGRRPCLAVGAGCPPLGGCRLPDMARRQDARDLRGQHRIGKTVKISGRRAVKEGAINSLANPKSLLFMFAFLPQFVDPAVGPIWLQLLILGSIQKLAGILSLGSVALASGTFGNWLSQHPGFLKWQERFTGVVMIGLGIRMLFSGGMPQRSVE